MNKSDLIVSYSAGIDAHHMMQIILSHALL